MSKFDPALWKTRAWGRFTRAVQAGNRSSEVLQHEWAKDVCAVSDLSKIVHWCRERHLKVDFVRKSMGTYHSPDRTIEISSRLSPKKQVIILLHECGHHLVGESDDRGRYNKGYALQDEPEGRSFAHRMACLDEEFEAWHRGWKLGQRLKAFTTYEEYEAVKASCLKSYMQWALDPTDWIEDV